MLYRKWMLWLWASCTPPWSLVDRYEHQKMFLQLSLGRMGMLSEVTYKIWKGVCSIPLLMRPKSKDTEKTYRTCFTPLLRKIFLFPTNTGWRMKCHTIDCTHNTFLLLQKHLTSGTELILIGWEIIPNEEHVQCDHRFALQPLAKHLWVATTLFVSA